MPPARRYYDRGYCKAPRRRRDEQPDAGETNVARMLDDLLVRARELGVDFIGSATIEDFAAAGVDLKAHLPDAAGAVVFGLGYPPHCTLNTDYHAARAEIELGKIMQERYGFSALPRSEVDSEHAAMVCGLAERETRDQSGREIVEGRANTSLSIYNNEAQDHRAVTRRFGERQVWRTIVTAAPVPRSRHVMPPPRADVAASPGALAEAVRRLARQAGADLVGIAPAERIAEAAPRLRELLAGDGYFVVEDEGWHIQRKALWGSQGHPYNPRARRGPPDARTPADHLPGARSVIVVGVGLLEASIDEVARPPAFKAGHYFTSVHEEAVSQLHTILLRVARLLDDRGHAAAPAVDLCGLGSRVGMWYHDLLSSRFAAVAAGLGEIGWHGMLLTPRFGVRQRVACLVTDAALPPDEVYGGPALCTKCFACVRACPMAAIDGGDRHAIRIGGREFQWGRLDRLRCDFSKRYGLTGESGGKYAGCRNAFTPPQTITPQWLTEAVRNSDRIQRPGGYTPVVERCFTACPAHRRAPQPQTAPTRE